MALNGALTIFPAVPVSTPLPVAPVQQAPTAPSILPLPAMENARPKCGSDPSEQGTYDFTLHVVALFLVLGASIFGAGFPVVAKKIKWLRIPPKVFFICKHFGTGVLIATAFVHLLPTAFSSLNDPCLPPLFTEQYPALPGVIGLGSLFCLFAIEMYLHSKMGGHGHSHGGADGAEFSGQRLPRQPSLRRQSLGSVDTWVDEKAMMAKELGIDNPFDDEKGKPNMPAWFIVFYEQYVRQREEMMGYLQKATPSRLSYGESKNDTKVTENSYLDEGDDPDLEHQKVDPLVFRKMNLDITLLEGGILFHSVFVGMTVSITSDGFIILLIAILFHQTFEGLGLGSRIAAVPYPKGAWKPWLLVVAFGTTAPIGQAIGLITRGSYDPNSAFALILVGTFNAISSGLLIYAALVDLLQQDFLSEESDRVLTQKQKNIAFMYVLMGAAGMSIVGAFA